VPESFRTNVLGEALDANNVLIENANTEAVNFALLFEFAGDVKATRHVMYNCTVARPAVGSQTKEENIEPQTESLTITSKPRTDGLVKSKTGDTTATATYEGWYSEVYVPTLETATPGTPGATG
jgi:phi13 family phage major tail protein